MTIPAKAQNRALKKCGGCGQKSTRVVDGKEIHGMPGLFYNYCNGCGWSRSITFKAPRVALRGSK